MCQLKRHWLLWHDYSTLYNNGHILFGLKKVYDPAIHLSDQEGKAKLGSQVDVQASIEKPLSHSRSKWLKHSGPSEVCADKTR